MIDRIILASTIVLAIAYLYATTLIPSLEIGDPLGPKAFPNLIGIIMLFAAGLLALEMWKERKAARPAAEEESPFDPAVVKVLAGVVVWTGIYYASFQSVGFIVATSVFLLGLMIWFHPGKWISNILSSVGFSGLIYWLFVSLDVSLPKGILAF